jgi:peptide/nickel transport system substrate-binding protein
MATDGRITAQGKEDFMRMRAKWALINCFSVLTLMCFGYPGASWGAPSGKIVIAQGGEPTTLDPHMHAENYAFATIRQVYDHLISRVIKDGKLQHLPMLATSWEAINDTTWVFHLRKGVKFHNGEDLNAEAVKFSLDRILNPEQKAKYRWALTFIDRVEIVDAFTIKITTKVPAPTLITNLAYMATIVPPKYFREKGDTFVATNPVGTGPFKFVRWKKGDELVFEANENYWAGPPNLKTVIFRPIPEDATRVAALLGGDVDIVIKVPSHMVAMVNNSRRAKIINTPSALGTHVHLDSLRKGPLQDRRVRQAINYAVDKESIIKHVLEGYGQAMGTPLSPSHSGYDPAIKPYPYDPDKAKSLLKEAGYGDGFAITFNSPSGRYVKDKEFAEAIVGQLSKVGIKVNLQLHEWGNYMAKIYSPDGAGPMWTVGWASTFDADGVLTPLLGCGQQLSRYCNKEFDALLEQARSSIDQKKRERLYSQALKLVHDDAAWLFMHIVVDSYGVSNRVQNWEPTPDEGTALYMYGASVKD